MTASLVLFLGSLLVMMCLGVPLFVTLAMASIVYMLASGQTFLVMMMARRIFAGINSFTLLAIPLFILCGDLLSSGKVSKMLISFAESLVGTMRGSLAIVTTVASMFFGAVSGSGVATASAIGSVVAPEAEAKGYDKKFIAAIVATSGALGILIPPSIPMVIYGAITGTSIAKLLLSGIGPGLMFGLVICGYSYWYSRKKGYEPSLKKLSLKKIYEQFKKSLWALITPLIILGGIYAGIFTPTEAAAVSTVYALFISMVVYKSITLKQLPEILLKSAITNATVMLITGSIVLFNWVLAREQIPQALTRSILSYIHSPIAFLFFTMLVLLIAGMFIDIPAAIILLAPLFSPVVTKLGIDPVYYGAFMVSNLAIGLVTPPVALNLYISSMICDLNFALLIKEVLPLVVILLLTVASFVFLPGIITFIPKLLMG